MARSSAAPAPARASNGSSDAKTVRCAIYTRKSTEEGLQQEFNSFDAQREASEAFITSQKHDADGHARAENDRAFGREFRFDVQRPAEHAAEPANQSPHAAWITAESPNVTTVAGSVS